MGLCPFHNEKTPSFTVHAIHQFYKCFSCGAGGDVFKFVMEIEGLSFYEALKSLAERYGIPMPKRSQYADDDSRCAAPCSDARTGRRSSFRANLTRAGGRGGARLPGASAAWRRRPSSSSAWATPDRSGRALLRLFEQREFPAAQMEQSGLVRQARGRQLLRPLPQPPDVSHPQRIGQDHRLRRARAGGRRRAQVPELAGNADLQEEPRALQPASRQGGDSQGRPRDPGGRLHGRDRRDGGGLPRRGGELRHGADARSRCSA